MRPMLQAGALGGGALAAGVKAGQEDEDLGSRFLASLGGGAGALGGLYGARALAGKFSPAIIDALNKGGQTAKQKLYNYAITNPSERPFSKQALNMVSGMDSLAPKYKELAQADPSKAGLARGLGAATAVATVPAAALAGGFGGVVAGGIPGAMGMPGFVDPESYGSSNSPGARYKQTTMNYI